jgi:hypothetical protein
MNNQADLRFDVATHSNHTRIGGSALLRNNSGAAGLGTITLGAAGTHDRITAAGVMSGSGGVVKTGTGILSVI